MTEHKSQMITLLDFLKNKPTILQAHGLLFGENTQNQAHGLIKILLL